MIGIIAVLLLSMWLLFFVALHFKLEYFTYISSAGLILLSVYMISNGIEGVDNFVTKGLCVLQIGIGIIGSFSPLYETLNGGEE